MSKLVEQIIEAYGGTEEAMAALGVTTEQAFKNWGRRGVPFTKWQQIHDDTGISLELLLASKNNTPT